MNNLVRTTITLPNELFERLKVAAFYQKRTISDLVRDGISMVVDYKKTAPGSGIAKLIGKYAVKGKKGEFSRKDYYAKIIRKKMSA